jgi:hypothetical protein
MTRFHEDPMMARKTGDTASCRHGERCLTLARARAEPLAIHFGKKGLFPASLQGRLETQKAPPPKRRGWLIPMDQVSLRRDQIRLKLSSPSPFTSEA